MLHAAWLVVAFCGLEKWSPRAMRDLSPLLFPLFNRGTSLRDYIGEDKTFALDRFTYAHGNLLGEHRPRRDRGVKFAVLAARVDAVRQVAQQFRIEAPSGETAIELARIEARDARGKPACNHVAREAGGIALPQRKDRLHPHGGQFFDAVGTNVFEEKIAEHDVAYALGFDARTSFFHARAS